MPDYAALVSLIRDPVVPRDNVVNTLTFRDNGVTSDPEQLATDLATIYQQFALSYLGGRVEKVNVRFYDLSEALPRPVAGEAEIVVNSTNPDGVSEVALCLSFYADRNVPRHRGRIYVGPFTSANMVERPSTPLMNSVLGLASSFADLGGADVSWMIRSRVDNALRGVQHAYVDNEWDTQRRRGLRATARVSSTHGEGG